MKVMETVLKNMSQNVWKHVTNVYDKRGDIRDQLKILKEDIFVAKSKI